VKQLQWAQAERFDSQQFAQTRQRQVKTKTEQRQRSAIAIQLRYMPGVCDKKQLCAQIGWNEYLPVRQAMHPMRTKLQQ